MPYMQSTITGVVANMEVQRANGSQLDDQAINNVKVGMMGRWRALVIQSGGALFDQFWPHLLQVWPG